MESFLKKYGLKSKNNQHWGIIDGYWYVYVKNPSDKTEKSLLTSVYVEGAEQKAQLDTFLQSLSDQNQILSYSISNGVITVRLPFKSSNPDAVEELALRMTDFFRQIKAQPSCSICNQPAHEAFTMVNDTVLMVCPHCQEGIESDIVQSEQEYALLPNRYFSGFLGALLGAFIGSLIWVAIGALGFIAVLGGIAIAYGAIKGYTLFKGKATKFSAVIITLVCLLALIFAQFLSMDILVYREFASEGITFGEILPLTFHMLTIFPELVGEYVKDTLIGLVFLAVGSYPYLKQLFKAAANPAGRLKKI